MDDGVKHLVRHRRFHKFRGVSKFGLNGSFQAVKMVGRGGTGQTWLCKDLAAGGDLVALKLQERPIPSDTVTMTFNEIMVQSTEGDGVFLTRIRDVLLSPTHLALSLEYEAGGNLAEYVARRLPQVGRDELAISEDEVRYLFRQLMAGIASLHRHHIAHRDIKLDNVLLDGNDPPTLKLADFQFA